MQALDILALSYKYTEETVIGGGAVKGKNCTVSSITDIEGGKRVTFMWTLDDGTEKTSFMDVMNGDSGVGIVSMEADGNVLVIVTSDGQSYEIPIPTVAASAVEDMADVQINKETLANGQILKWDAELGRWVNATGGGGGGGSLEDDLTTSVTVGGITSGTTYPADTPLETILRNMLNPVAYPALTNPSASLSATGAKLLETGASLSVTFTLTLNRGSISPQYTAASPYRSGEATQYKFDGEITTNNTFVRTVTSAVTSYYGNIDYAAGVQPKDSVGNNYNSPLPAGTVKSNTISYEFVSALWANTSNIATVAKLALVSKSAKVKQFDFPAQTASEPEIFDVPATGWNVTAVEVLNTLSNQWEDCSAEFAITTVSHNDASGNAEEYKRYTCNLGYATGARKIRIKWS